MIRKFLVYLEKEDSYSVIYSDKDENVREVSKLPPCKEYGQFYIQKGYDATDDGLRSYYIDFCEWIDQLHYNEIFSFYYATYYNHYHAVKAFYKKLGKYQDAHEPIDVEESSWIEACPNGGLQFCKPGSYKCHSYDFNFNYPRELASKQYSIPTKKGYTFTKKKIEEKSSDVKIGMYRCMITCDNKEFRKIFMFSKKHTYTHYSVRFAIDNKKKFNVKIEIINDGKPNAYLYKPKDCITGNEIFHNWLEVLLKLRQEFPKNKLVKHLGSSIWGSLNKFVKTTRTEDQLSGMSIGPQEQGYEYDIVDYKYKANGEIKYYELMKYNNIYSDNIRLKNFLTAPCRNKTANLALQDLDNVVRVHTDCVTFTKPQNISKYQHLKEESKTSGKITFVNVNNYYAAKNEE